MVRYRHVVVDGTKIFYRKLVRRWRPQFCCCTVPDFVPHVPLCTGLAGAIAWCSGPAGRFPTHPTASIPYTSHTWRSDGPLTETVGLERFAITFLTTERRWMRLAMAHRSAFRDHSQNGKPTKKDLAQETARRLEEPSPRIARPAGVLSQRRRSGRHARSRRKPGRRRHAGSALLGRPATTKPTGSVLDSKQRRALRSQRPGRRRL